MDFLKKYANVDGYASPPDITIPCATWFSHAIIKHEFLGIICAAHVFAEHTRGCRTDLISDSDTCVKAILNDGAHAAQMQWLHLEYISSNSTLHTINSVRHAHGEINVPADLASRDRLPELLELSAQLHITPTQLPVPDSFLDILRRFEDTFGSQPTPPRSAKALSLEARRGKGFSSDDLGDGPSPPSGPPPTRTLSQPPPPLTTSPPALPSPLLGSPRPPPTSLPPAGRLRPYLLP